jgi:hypothetical protein
MMNARMPTKTKVKNWLQTIDLAPEVIVDPNAEFVFRIKRAHIKLYVHRQNNVKWITVQATFKLPKENEELYNPKIDAEFRRMMHQRLPMYNTDMVFLPGSSFMLFDRVFDDGFSFDRLYSTIKCITIAGFSAHKILFSAVGLEPDDAIEVAKTDFQSHYI